MAEVASSVAERLDALEVRLAEVEAYLHLDEKRARIADSALRCSRCP